MLDELCLIGPHVDRYAHRVVGGEIAVCAACGRQLDALAEEMEASRRWLIRRWPTPRAYRDALMDDQRLSRTFETVRDTEIMEVLATAIWYDRRYDRAYLAVPIPVAPRAVILTVADVDELSADAVYWRCIETDADHAPLERELATRFFRTGIRRTATVCLAHASSQLQ